MRLHLKDPTFRAEGHPSYGSRLCNQGDESRRDHLVNDVAYNLGYLYNFRHSLRDLAQRPSRVTTWTYLKLLLLRTGALTYGSLRDLDSLNKLKHSIFNRPGVAGAVLHKASLLIKSLSYCSFSSQSSRYHKSQTVRARELKF